MTQLHTHIATVLMRAKTRAWTTLLMYCLLDFAVLLQTWTQQAPDDLGSVTWKGWAALATSLLISQIKQIKSVLNQDWSNTSDTVEPV